MEKYSRFTPYNAVHESTSLSYPRSSPLPRPLPYPTPRTLTNQRRAVGALPGLPMFIDAHPHRVFCLNGNGKCKNAKIELSYWLMGV